ncbi:hypothetical protein T439DRAFT_56828 [Meredithblackwellia eburnea MCA 4105]
MAKRIHSHSPSPFWASEPPSSPSKSFATAANAGGADSGSLPSSPLSRAQTSFDRTSNNQGYKVRRRARVMVVFPSPSMSFFICTWAICTHRQHSATLPEFHSSFQFLYGPQFVGSSFSTLSYSSALHYVIYTFGTQEQISNRCLRKVYVKSLSVGRIKGIQSEPKKIVSWKIKKFI